MLSGFLDALNFKSIDGSIEEIIRLTAERDVSEEIDEEVIALADEIPGGHHSEYAWAERVGPMLKFLFPRRG